MAKRSPSPGQMLTAALFVFYLIALTWIIVCKMALPGDALPHLRSVNLIPFGEPLLVNGQADYSEAVQNALAFVPFGIYLGMLLPGRPLWKRLLPAALVSLLYECLQFVFALGMSDITDWLCNMAGALAGLAVYAGFAKICGAKAHLVLNILAAAASAAMAGLLTLLLLLN